MKSKKKWIISLITSLSFIITVPVIVSNAYLNQNVGWSSPSIPIKNSASSAYTSVVNNSIAAWNNAVPGVNIYYTKKASNTITSGNYADSWTGRYFYYTRGGKTYKFNIQLNDRLLADKSDNYKQSVLVHELGHALSLADNPPQSPSIMRHDRDRNTIITPQQDDIDGVKSFYRLK